MIVQHQMLRVPRRLHLGTRGRTFSKLVTAALKSTLSHDELRLTHKSQGLMRDEPKLLTDQAGGVGREGLGMLSSSFGSP